MKKQLILASGSPRRTELLSQIELPHTIVIADVEEHPTADNPEGIVRELASQKCRAVADQLSESAVILGADTVVAADGRVLGKPASKEEAMEMLTLLQGRAHEVYTGVALIDRSETAILRETVFAVCTRVHVQPMREEEIRWYVETQEPFDKAGAYGAQGPFARYIERFEGEYCNVIGLPVHAVYNQLVKWDLIRN